MASIDCSTSWTRPIRPRSEINYTYTATQNELRIFSHVSSGNGTEWDRMYVYVKASGAQDLCDTVSV